MHVDYSYRIFMQTFDYWVDYYNSDPDYTFLWGKKDYHCWAGVGYFIEVWVDSKGDCHQLEIYR